MTLQIDFWQLLGFGGVLLAAFSAIVVGAGRLIANQFQKGQAESISQITSRLDRIEAVNRDEAAQWQRVEREFLRFQADLPLQYVRREDYVRGQVVMEAKQDALYSKVEAVQLQLQLQAKGGGHG